MNFKRLKNNTKVPQSIFFGGKQVTLAPNATGLFEGYVADLFVAKCGNLVSLVTTGEPVAPPTENEQVWLANMTGDIDAPDEISVRKMVKGEERRDMVPNPKKEARELSWHMKGSQEEFTSRSGVIEARNSFGKIYTIPPYGRRQFPKEVAKWIKSRDAMSEVQTRGSVEKCRPPSSFEPTADWPLDDIRSYLQLLDANISLGNKSEAFIRSAAKRRKNADPVDTEKAIYEEKEVLMKKLHFRICDKDRVLPSKAEFDAFVNGDTNDPSVEEKEVEVLTEKLSG